MSSKMVLQAPHVGETVISLCEIDNDHICEIGKTILRTYVTLALFL